MSGICLKFSSQKKKKKKTNRKRQETLMSYINHSWNGNGYLGRFPMSSLLLWGLKTSVTKLAGLQDIWHVGDMCKETSLGSLFLFSRLCLLWEEEVSKHGIEKASVLRVMMRFQRTRAILDVFLCCCFSAMSVLGPVSGWLHEVWETPGFRN